MSSEFFNQKQPTTLALIDLDGFKTINDTLGHDIGDELLKEFSRLLKQLSNGTSVFVSRLGGDEFALMYPSATLEETIRISEKLLEQLTKPLLVNEFELFISASIGICNSSGEDLLSVQLFKHADIALYNAKAAGKRRISVYSHSHDIETLKRFTLVRDIQKAIAGNQFYLEYQPRYDIKNKRVTCVEALLRWKHPSWGIISPSEFIPIAEESGLIGEMGKWALQTACREIKPIANYLNFNLSVNVSVIQIMNKEFISTIKQILEVEGFNPNKLELEITESALHNSEEMMKNFLEELKCLNIHVSLDDFGTGYSSLSFIQKYAVDTVKIDKTFVNTLTANERNAKIFSSIVSLLKSLETNVVAEGIETIEHFAYLTKNHCDEAQGYLFSKPIPVDELIEVIQEIPNFNKAPSTYKGEERRKLFRVALKEDREMELTIVSIKGKPVSVGYTVIKVLDIGPGGLAISLGVNLPISSDILYQFTGNFHGEDISVQGQIVWMEELTDGNFHYGVSFIHKSEREQSELIQFLNRVSIKQQK